MVGHASRGSGSRIKECIDTHEFAENCEQLMYQALTNACRPRNEPLIPSRPHAAMDPGLSVSNLLHLGAV